jgi:hypothetical protein
MTIEANLIAGLMLGIEYVHSSSIEDCPAADDYHMFVVDLLFVRFVIAFG